MPQQPELSQFLDFSGGESTFAISLFHRGPHFVLHELADGVANQFLMVVEGKIHRLLGTNDATTTRKFPMRRRI